MSCTNPILYTMDPQVLNQLLTQILQDLQPLAQNPPIVPSLDLSNLGQPNQQSEEVHTPPPLLPVDQWHTAVSVQVEIDGDFRRIKWFSDLQLAWMSVNDFVRENPDESWTLRTFQQTARIMKERWLNHRGDEGFVIAKTDGIKFRAFYEPEENESVRQNSISSQPW